MEYNHIKFRYHDQCGCVTVKQDVHLSHIPQKDYLVDAKAILTDEEFNSLGTDKSIFYIVDIMLTKDEEGIYWAIDLQPT